MGYEKIRHEVERVLGRRMRSHGDFGLLACKIKERTGERLSPTTLMRVWDYNGERVNPRTATMNVLARFVGFSDYDAFCEGDGRVDSCPVLARHLTSRDVAEGQCVRLCWQPDRVCVIRHEGEGKWRVVEAEHTKLSVGDTFECHLIVEREPLYLNSLTHGGESDMLYIAGRTGGVVFDVME